MNVRLLNDVWETDKDGNRAGLKVAMHRGKAVPFVAGAVIEMSDSSAAKYIQAGKAEAVSESEGDGSV